MDFGLSKYLEMFEERFGRKASTVLLCLITLAIVALCLDFAYHKLFLPIYRVTLTVTGNESLYLLLKDRAIAIFISTLIVACLAYFLNRLGMANLVRRLSKWSRNVEKQHAQLDTLIKSCTTQADALASFLADAEVPDEVKQKVLAVRERHRLLFEQRFGLDREGANQSETTGTQSPSGTGPRTPQ